MNTSRQLRRSESNRMIGGVCAGVADFLGVDTAVVRVLTAVGALFSLGTVALIYLVMWVLVPQATTDWQR